MGEVFKMLAVGQSDRCIMEFLAIPATFCNTEIKRNLKKINFMKPWHLQFRSRYCRHPLFISPVLFSTFVDSVPTIAG